MKKNDVSYLNEDGSKKFNYRVALLAVNDNKILLQKSEKDSYYSLIGGRVQLFEDSEQAIKREVEEETGILLNSSEIKLVNIVENFFTFNKTDFHEMLFIYKTDSKELAAKDNFATLDKMGVINKWFDIDKLQNMDVRPEFIKKSYANDKLTSLIIKG